MKLWMASISLVTRLIRSPVCLLVVVGQREALDVRVQCLAQIVHHPLADAGGEIFFGVGANGADGRDSEREQGGPAQHRQPVVAGHRQDQVVEPAVRVLRPQHVVEHNFQRPGLQEIGGRLAHDRHDCNGQSSGVGPQQVTDGKGLR